MLNSIVRVALVVGAAIMIAGPARPDDKQIRTKAAIDAAVVYLKQNYKTANPQGADAGPMAGLIGTGGGGASSGWEEGPTALAGISLMEAGVKADDPVIQDIARIIRSAAIKQNQTYVLSLDILFLDKLGEQIDTTLIQSMGVRLLKGQNRQGGWTYNCPDLPPEEQARLRNAVGTATLKGGKELPTVGSSVDSRPRLDPGNEEMLKKLPQLNGSDDNSNTQFATIALFTARRHGVPAEQALRGVENRFRQLQNRQDGGWSYTSTGVQISTAPMTCAGLVGLAVGKGIKRETTMKSKGHLGSDGKLQVEPGKPGAGGGNEPNPLQDAQVQKALRFVVACCKASGTKEPNRGGGQPAGPAAAGGPMAAGGPEGMYGSELRNNLYFMWSLERVCAIFSLNDINGFDWHDWGVKALLQTQGNDGSWDGKRFGGKGYGGVVDTSFALMFLTKANIVKDLTKLLKSGDLPNKPSETRPGGGIAGNTKPPENPPAPANPAKESASSALTDALIKAGPAEQKELIKRYEESKGTAYSQALADAIPKLKGENQQDARDALFQRMCRMSANTLKAWLKEADNAELRRAAALAMCRRDDVAEMKGLVPNLIEALTDPEEIVWRAAGLSLHEIAKQTPGAAEAARLGPHKDDSEAKRRKAAEDWKVWHQKHSG